MRSRGARGTRAANTSTSGQVISRVRPSVKATRGRVAWKSKNSSGSIVAKRDAFSDAPTNCSAAEAASPASFHPLKAQTRAGARRPSGRLSHRRGCIRVTVQDARVAIAALQAGQQVDAVFACTRKDRLVTRTGTPYLALELRDRTGTVAARAFRDADVLAGRFDRGDLVRVRGRVDRYRDELQVEVAAIDRVEAPDADPSAFLPTAYRDLDELDGFLEHLAGEVSDPGFRGLLDGMLGDEVLRAGLRRSPCTRGGHHAYLGGLLEHTVAVATLAQETCVLHVRLDADLLLTAAIVHDIGKTREFTYTADIGLSDEGRLLGHVELGLRMLDERASRVPALDDARRLALAHCVLTHHGPDASPTRRFASSEAVALYRINALDAAVKGAIEHGPAAPAGA